MNRLLIFFVSVMISFSCSEDIPVKNVVSCLYKYDSLTVLPGDNPVYNRAVFAMKENKLYLLHPDETPDRRYEVKFRSETRQILIRDWKEGEYALQEQPYDGKYPLLWHADTFFFLEGRKLKYSFHNTVTECCDFVLCDEMYNQMIAEDGYYAIRTGRRVYVSRDLKQWKIIYDSKRGISKSLAFVKDKSGQRMQLLLSEYTPGSERFRHHVLKYDFKTDQFKTVLTFYRADEGEALFARHIHILEKDPYTGDIWVGTGDTDNESHVLRSTDGGETFQLVGSGSQKWRVLAFIFTPEYVFWNTDSHEAQYITRVSRDDIKTDIVPENVLKRFSIINGACWGTVNLKTATGKDMVVMASNHEGGLYDDYSRTYGIILESGVPEIYELTKLKARSVYTQLFPIGVNADHCLVLFDHEIQKYMQCKLVEKVNR